MKPGSVVISGASTGIGAATASLLAAKGFTTYAGVRNAADALRIAALGENVRPIMLDVTSQASINDAVGEVRAGSAGLFGIVSNAGIAIGGALEHTPIDELRRQFEVNVFGAIGLVQSFLPLLSDETGRIVLVGSISGRLATPYLGPYSASKFALRALAEALRVELAPSRIVVSLIEPGSVKTPIWRKGRETRDAMTARLAGSTRPHYRVALERMLALTETEERDGMPAEVVAQAIAHALTARKPRSHYLLGGSARMGSIVALLPAGLRDRAMRVATRVP